MADVPWTPKPGTRVQKKKRNGNTKNRHEGTNKKKNDGGYKKRNDGTKKQNEDTLAKTTLLQKLSFLFPRNSSVNRLSCGVPDPSLHSLHALPSLSANRFSSLISASQHRLPQSRLQNLDMQPRWPGTEWVSSGLRPEIAKRMGKNTRFHLPPEDRRNSRKIILKKTTPKTPKFEPFLLFIGFFAFLFSGAGQKPIFFPFFCLFGGGGPKPALYQTNGVANQWRRKPGRSVRCRFEQLSVCSHLLYLVKVPGA